MSSEWSNADQMRKRYHRLKDAGLCVVCGKVPPEEGKVRCLDCKIRLRPAQSRAIKKAKIKNRQNGKCACGRQPKPGRKWCVICASKMNARKKNTMANNRAKGLCTCGRIPCDGLKSCAVCLEKRQEYKENMKLKKVA